MMMRRASDRDAPGRSARARGPRHPGGTGRPRPVPASRSLTRGRPTVPGTTRPGPSCSSIRISRLYLATRSLRDGAPVLIWPGAGGDREVGDEGVLGLARAVRDHRRVARAAGQVHRGERLRERADLVDLDQQGVAGAELDALLQARRVGDEEVVADQLHAVAPRRSVSATQPSQSSSAMPSSIEMIG